MHKKGGKSRPSSHSATDRLIIEDIGPKGDGIARNRNGQTVFIERGLPGDEVDARVAKSDDGMLRGTIERIIAPSHFRVNHPCEFYERCGGCSLQHVHDEFYEGFKDNIVRAPLSKMGLKPHYLQTIFCRPESRRRATFAVLPQGKGLLMGYYKRRSHMITDIPDCLVVHDDVLVWRERIRPHLKSIITGSKPVDVFIQVVDGNAEIVITGAVGAKGVPDLTVREAAGRLVRDTGAARVAWRKSGYDVPEILVQDKPLLAQFGPLSVPLPPNAFMQPTLEGQHALTDAVMEFLPPTPKAIADLFAGCGTFSGPLLESGARVDAYDISGVDQLAKAANGHPLKTFKRDLFDNPVSRDELNKYDVVVFDPPRAGCAAQAKEIAHSKVKCAIGVSCNPTTFAKDARILCGSGFKLEAVRIVDQFVWSHHVELVALFTR